LRGAPGDRGPARYVIVIDFAEADCPAAWPTMSSITSCGSPAIADYRPTDPQIAWHLARFIENVRSIPADPVIVRQNWLSAYDFVTDKGAVTLNDYARSNDPFTKVRKIQVAVEISSVIRASPESFRVAWIERRYEDGSLAATERWTDRNPHRRRRYPARRRSPAQEPPRCVRPCRQLVEGARLMRSASIVVLGLVTSMLPGGATFKPPQIGYDDPASRRCWTPIPPNLCRWSSFQSCCRCRASSSLLPECDRRPSRRIRASGLTGRTRPLASSRLHQCRPGLSLQ